MVSCRNRSQFTMTMVQLCQQIQQRSTQTIPITSRFVLRQNQANHNLFFVAAQKIIYKIMNTRTETPTKTTYFRRKTKTSYALNWRNAINLQKIAGIISEKEQIEPHNLQLFHKGQRLSLNTPYSSLQHMQIVHIINLSQVQQDSLTIWVRSSAGVRQYQVESSMKVKDFICGKIANINTLPYFYIGLVYLGKVMNPQKTFREELVENQAEIVCVDIRDYIAQKKQQDNIMNITDIIEGKKIQVHKRQSEDDVPEIVLNQHPPTIANGGDPDLVFEAPQQKNQPQNQPNAPKDQLYLEKNRRGEAVDLNQTKYPLSIYQLQLQSRYDGPHNETRLLLDRLDSLEEMPQSELPSPKFEIKISQVDSLDSDEQNKNRVQFNQQDSHSIYSEEIEQVPSKLEETPPSEQLSKRTQNKREEVGSRDLQLGDFLMTGSGYKSQTANFLDKMLQDYKFMLDKA